HRDGARNLAAETAAGICADHYDFVLRFVGRNADPARDGGDSLNGALCRSVQIQLAVLPVRHRRARLERLVPGGRTDEGLVQHHSAAVERFFEARLDVAKGPLVSGFAERKLAVWRVAEIGLGPFPFLNFGSGRRATRRASPSASSTPLAASAALRSGLL